MLHDVFAQSCNMQHATHFFESYGYLLEDLGEPVAGLDGAEVLADVCAGAIGT